LNIVKLSVFGNWNLTCAIENCTETQIVCETFGELLENRQQVYLNNMASLIVE